MLSRQGSAHPNIAPYGDSYTTKDKKRVLLAIGSDRQFDDLLSVLAVQFDSNQEAARYSNNQKRVENRFFLNQKLAQAIGTRDSEELLRELHKKKIPAGLIRTVKETFELPQANELLMRQDELTGVRGFVGQGSKQNSVKLNAPPHLGEHTQQILLRLGK